METVSFMWTIVLIGISTVFICLISLVLMVSLFKRIFVRDAKPAQATILAERGIAKGIDPAIVAVIIAAIAVSGGVPAASIRLASIRHASFNTPVWGYVDRVASGTASGRA
jgi:hypothetical protein